MSRVIHVKGLHKTFNKDLSALNDINLEISKGEMVSLIGPSGSGKSTLMRHISALTLGDKKTDSEITVLDVCMQKGGKTSKAARLNRAQIGCVFQQFNLVSRLKVMTNVLIGALGNIPAWRGYIGFFTQEEKAKALAALKRVGMDQFAYNRASTLSGGQQQRVAIARALMQEAEIILADEPVASLDPESSRIVMEILQDINEKDGKTVVVTLHQVELARKYFKRAIALKNGKLYFDGDAALLTDEKLASLYSSQQINELRDENSEPQLAANDTETEKEETVLMAASS